MFMSIVHIALILLAITLGVLILLYVGAGIALVFVSIISTIMEVPLLGPAIFTIAGSMIGGPIGAGIGFAIYVAIVLYRIRH